MCTHQGHQRALYRNNKSLYMTGRNQSIFLPFLCQTVKNLTGGKELPLGSWWGAKEIWHMIGLRNHTSQLFGFWRLSNLNRFEKIPVQMLLVLLANMSERVSHEFCPFVTVQIDLYDVCFVIVTLRKQLHRNLDGDLHPWGASQRLCLLVFSNIF